MFYIVGIFIRMSFVHAFIILWTQSNMNTRSAGHCVQPIVKPNCEHFGAYHWLFLCYSIFLSFSKIQDFCLSVWALVLFASVFKICCRSVTEDVGAAGTTCGWRVPSLPTDHIQGRLQQRYRRLLSNCEELFIHVKFSHKIRNQQYRILHIVFMRHFRRYFQIIMKNPQPDFSKYF